jgi:hypothetical protein
MNDERLRKLQRAAIAGCPDAQAKLKAFLHGRRLGKTDASWLQFMESVGLRAKLLAELKARIEKPAQGDSQL